MRRIDGLWVVVMALCACSSRGIVADGDDSDSDDGDGDTSSSAGSVTVVSDGDDDGRDSGFADTADTLDLGGQHGDEQWLLAMAVNLSPQTPLQWHVMVDWEGDEVALVRVQSLSLDSGSTTTPRELVGDPTIADELGIDDLGNFGLAFDALLVPAAANPITGSDISAIDVRLVGMGTATTSCGTVMGTITAPIETPLDGSTFAAVPIASVDDLPLEFPSACE